MQVARRSVLLVLLALAGCGNDDSPSALPPAAEPARSPEPAAPPAGRVVDVGASATGVAVDSRSGLVGVAAGAELVLLEARTLAERGRVRLAGPTEGAAAARLRAAVRRRGGARLDDGAAVTIDRRARRITVGDETVPAGIGPANVAVGDGGRAYVTDTDGGSVLLFRTRPELGLVRRAALPGAPYAAAVDREKGKLWVTVTETNEAVQLTADGAPRIQRRFPTVRQPNAIAVDARTGRVYVASATDGTVQAFDGYPPQR